MSERRVPDDELERQVGLNISSICTFGFTSEVHHTNHCAHFVSHMLGFSFGATCARGGNTIRVNAIYNRCTDRGAWDNRPSPLIYTMIFATQSSNMAQGGDMMDGPNKHMGIWRMPYVYNYSTMNRRVLRETVPDFLSRLEGVYDPGGNNPVRLFYGRNVS